MSTEAPRILAIEDDRAVQKVLKRLFETEGYSVDLAKDGLSGLERFYRRSPSAIILDLRLPDISGKEVCQQITRVAPDLPVIVLSAKAEVRAVHPVGQRHFCSSVSQFTITLMGSVPCGWSTELTRKRFPSADTSNGSHADPNRFCVAARIRCTGNSALGVPIRGTAFFRSKSAAIIVLLSLPR